MYDAMYDDKLPFKHIRAIAKKNIILYIYILCALDIVYIVIFIHTLGFEYINDIVLFFILKLFHILACGLINLFIN